MEGMGKIRKDPCLEKRFLSLLSYYLLVVKEIKVRLPVCQHFFCQAQLHLGAFISFLPENSALNRLPLFPPLQLLLCPVI
jgi:hypothetical protein